MSAHVVLADSNGYYIDLYKRGETPPLENGQQLIDSIPDKTYCKARYINGSWIETATPEENEAAKHEQQQIIKETVSDLEIAFAEYVIETEQRLTKLEGR